MYISYLSFRHNVTVFHRLYCTGKVVYIFGWDTSSDAAGTAASCVVTSCVLAAVFDASLVVMGARKAAVKAVAVTVAVAAQVRLVILVSVV